MSKSDRGAKAFGLSLNSLLIFLPSRSTLSIFRPDAHTLIFFASCIAIIPLAGLMGRATEQIANHAGEGIGGLLNATFGNAAELIIAIVALRAGQTEIVKASVTGSIIGNILLVLGAAFLAGGLRYRIQEFNLITARAQAEMLLVSAVAIIIPGLFHALRPDGIDVNEATISLIIACLLVVLYMSKVLVGVIIVAVIGNAAEHSTAVIAAMRNRMDLSLGIAIGSSTQVALFVAPRLVFLSYVIGAGPMDLAFT
jgi:Ca2+:H+ antiporter